MNKNIVKYLLTLAAAAVVGGGCNVDDYNTEYLDGFDKHPAITDVQSIKYTMTAADYSSVASNESNKAIAKAKGAEAEAALEAVGKSKCFTELAPADIYLPAILADKFDYYLDNGSTVTVTYAQGAETPEVITRIMSAKPYALVGDDYLGAWPDGTVKFFTPEKAPDKYLPEILKTRIESPAEGDMVMVTYTFYDGEPKEEAAASANAASAIRTGETVTVTPIGTIIETLKAGATTTVYTAEGKIVGLYAQGMLIEDETGTICVYIGKDYGRTGFALGDKIRATGTTQMRYNAPQFNNAGIELELVEARTGATEFAFPATTTITSANIPSALSYTPASGTEYAPFTHLSVTGTVIKSGNYFNLQVEGAAEGSYTASLTNPFESMQFSDELADKKVTVTGYINTINTGSKYFGLICTSLTEDGKTTQTQLGAAASKAGTYTSRGVVVGTYSRGFLMNDGTANMLVYENKLPSAAIGDIVEVSGATEIRYSMSQFKSTVTVAKIGTVADADAVRPAVATPAGEELDAYLAAPYYRYVKYTGTLTTNASGYYEIRNIEGAAQAFGSIKYAFDEQNTLMAKLKDKQVIVTGYLIGSNTSTGEASTMMLSISSATQYDTEKHFGLYTYDGTAWFSTTDAIYLDSDDYMEMGLNNYFFTDSQPADTYLPTCLTLRYPYAQPETVVNCAYFLNTEAEISGSQYTYNGTQWIKTESTEMLDGPFQKAGGKWNFNPSMTIVLHPTINTDLAKTYYQAVVDWVKANKDNKYLNGTSTEYYSGAAAGYGNLNWRINTLPWYYWKVVEGEESVKVYEDYKSDDVTLKKAAFQAFYTEAEKRFGEAMGGALSTLHADVKLIPGVDIVYTVQAYLYTQHHTDKELTHAFEFKLVANGKFEYVRMYALDPKFELMQDKYFQ